MNVRTPIFASLALSAAIVVACDSRPLQLQNTSSWRAPDSGTSSASPIEHVVIIIQENRSFNDFFATFPGADGTTTGQAVANAKCSPPISGGPIALRKMPLVLTQDLNHAWYEAYSTAYDDGRMDGFDKVPTTGSPESPDECSAPYQYTDPAQIKPYWTMASEYALAEHMFTTQGSGSFTAHQDLIRGGTIVQKDGALVDYPTCGNCFWGCDAPKGVFTHLVTAENAYVPNGPVPCSNRFKSSYLTLRDLLDAKELTWKYYVPTSKNIFGKLFSAFDLVYAVRHSPEWKTNISTPETNILRDVAKGKLPAMSWVVPEQDNSDHPGTSVDNGPEWVSTVVNAIGESAYWKSTAIFVLWDDWGGLYDNKGGILGQYAGPGARVPAIVISPYARAGYISSTIYQFGSILRYIEGNWNLGSLGTTDQTSTSIIDCFNYKQAPIPFQPISSTLGVSYFMHERHSYQPPDNDW